MFACAGLSRVLHDDPKAAEGLEPRNVLDVMELANRLRPNAIPELYGDLIVADVFEIMTRELLGAQATPAFADQYKYNVIGWTPRTPVRKCKCSALRPTSNQSLIVDQRPTRNASDVVNSVWAAHLCSEVILTELDTYHVDAKFRRESCTWPEPQKGVIAILRNLFGHGR